MIDGERGPVAGQGRWKRGRGGRSPALAVGLLMALAGCNTPSSNEGPPVQAQPVAPVTSAPLEESSSRAPGYSVGQPYTINGVTYTPREDFAYDETGQASWYGEPFHGRRTASGEIFNRNDLTAAHPTLPMPSVIRVTNLANDQSVVVRVNDRGPFIAGRIVELSEQAAAILGYHEAGTAQVRVQILTSESRQLAGLAPLEPTTSEPSPGTVVASGSAVTAAPAASVNGAPLRVPTPGVRPPFSINAPRPPSVAGATIVGEAPLNVPTPGVRPPFFIDVPRPPTSGTTTVVAGSSTDGALGAAGSTVTAASAAASTVVTSPAPAASVGGAPLNVPTPGVRPPFVINVPRPPPRT